MTEKMNKEINMVSDGNISETGILSKEAVLNVIEDSQDLTDEQKKRS